jgi:2,5-diketo-D-gluconate reductase A
MTTLIRETGRKPETLQSWSSPHAAPVRPLLPLNDANLIPRMGLCTGKMSDGEAQIAVADALKIGYRLIDTAARYANEAGVGRGLRAGGVPREEIFLATKLRGADHGYNETLRGFDASLERLGTSYVDLCLIHWPLPTKNLYDSTWRALVRLQEEGRARSIGVCNFLPKHIHRLVAVTGIRPAVNQLELHLRFTQAQLRDWHVRNGIQVASWCPLGRTELPSHPLIESIARKHERSAAQIMLRWHMQHGLVAIPEATDVALMRQYLDVFDFALDSADLQELATLDGDQRHWGDPEIFDED